MTNSGKSGDSYCFAPLFPMFFRKMLVCTRNHRRRAERALDNKMVTVDYHQICISYSPLRMVSRVPANP
jgi:hypothetical protein